jgi:hypothetical protein
VREQVAAPIPGSRPPAVHGPCPSPKARGTIQNLYSLSEFCQLTGVHQVLWLSTFAQGNILFLFFFFFFFLRLTLQSRVVWNSQYVAQASLKLMTALLPQPP